MDVDRLVIAGAFDPTDIETGAARGADSLRRFTGDAEAVGGRLSRAFGDLTSPLARTSQAVDALAGELRALDALADSVHLARPEDVRAIQQMAGDVRGLAAAAGLTAEQFRQLESVEQRIAAFAPSTRPLVRPAPAPVVVVPTPDPADIERKAVQAADTFIVGLTRELTVRQVDAREALFLGLSDRAGAHRAGREAAAEFNARIIAELQRLGDRGELLPAVHQKLVKELRDAGLEAGRAATAGIERGTAGAAAGIRTLGTAARETGTRFGGLVAATGEFTALGRRAANASIAVAFGLEALARGGSAAEGGVRTALRSVAALAPAFGPQGLLVSGIAATTATMLDLFRSTRDEAAKTAASLRTEAGRLLDIGDFVGLQKKGRDILTGQPSAGEGFGGSSDFFQGSLRSLEAEAADIARRIDEATRQRNVFIIGALEKRQRELTDQIKAKREDLNEVIRDINRLDQVPDDIRGALPEVRVTAEGPARRQTETLREQARRAKEDVASAQRELTLVRRAIEEAESQSLALAGERLTGRDTASEFVRAIQALVGLVNADVADAPVLLRARIATTREELEQQIRAALPDDNVFALRLTTEINEAVRTIGAGGSAGVANPFLDPEFQPGGKFDTLERFTHTAADDFEAVARDADLVARAFSQLPGLADSLAGQLAGTVAGGLGGAAAIARGVDVFKGDDITAKLTGLAGIASGGLGVVGAIGGLVASLTQESALQHEANAILRQNTDALNLARAERQGFNPESQQSLDLAVRAIQGIRDDPAARADIASRFRRGVTGTRETVEDVIERFGLSLAELDAIVQQTGVELFTSTGQIDPRNLEAFQTAIREAADAARHFTGSFDDQARKLDLGDRIFGRDTPADAFNRQRELLRRFDEPVARMFDGLDVTTAAGLAQARQALQNVFTQFSEGSLSIGGLDKDQFLSILGDTDDALDRLADSARDAASNLSDLNANITGFRVAEFRFRAQAPESPFGSGGTSTGGGGTTVTIPPLVLDPVVRPPVLFPTDTTGAAAQPIELHLHMDDAKITTAATSPDELLAALLRAAATKGRNSTGLSRDALLALARALGSSAAGVAQ